jgi:hypothetical protein
MPYGSMVRYQHFGGPCWHRCENLKSHKVISILKQEFWTFSAHIQTVVATENILRTSEDAKVESKQFNYKIQF